MKFSMKYIISTATIVIILISGYQSYWLIKIYHNLNNNLQKNLKEAVRAADFEEIVYRVGKMKEDHFGGKMDITVAANPETEKTELRNESKRSLDAQETETNLDTNLDNPKFDDALKNAEDVMNVGLSMQRGIHSGLDKLRKPYFEFYDKAITARLDSLGVTVPHATLYLKNNPLKNRCDTLQRIGGYISEADTFRLALDMNTHTEYVVLVPHRNYAVLKQMKAPLLYSLVTLVILLLAFAYIINMIKRMKQLDEMKSDFTNNITHELKTPIAVTYAAVDSMLNFHGADDPEKSKKYLSICQDQLRLLTTLVEQILSVSMERRNMILNIDSLEVKTIVEQAVNNQKVKSPDAFISINIPESMTVRADKMHFSNIVNNLIDNAIKYSDNKPHVEINGYIAGNGSLELSFIDHGIGISKDNQKYIFEKFYRVPHGNIHSVKGYGLGLYYVKSMMEKFGGTISVNSELGKGSTFKLHFNG